MKITRRLNIFLFWLFTFVTAVVSGDNVEFGSISLILGKTYIQKQLNKSWNVAQIKSAVFEHDKLKTQQKSRCEVKLTNSKILRIGEKTTVELILDNDGNEKAYIPRGKAWINIFRSDCGGKFKIRTPTSVCAIRGTVYRISSNSNFSSYRVYNGSIAVSPLDEEGNILPDTTFIVKAGSELILARDFEEYKRQQQEAFQKFLDEQQLGFEEYMRQQEEFFQEFKRMEEEAFRKFKSFHVALEEYDQEKDKQLDWVKWNLKRDKLIKP